MSYTLAKVLHVTAMLVWLGSMLWQARNLNASAGEGGDDRLERSLVLNYLVVLPAMIFTWLFGLYLAASGGWLGARWFAVKLGFVLSLSGVYILQSVALGRWARGRNQRLGGLARLVRPWILIAAASAIALAFLKPF